LIFKPALASHFFPAANALCERFSMTVTMVADTQKYYDDMNFRISSADQTQWAQAILAAEATHLDDPAVMCL
jgi:hypothetical protein